MNQAFISHFKINEQTLRELESEAKSGASLIGLAIEKKIVDESAYLKWAQEYYGLALLRAEFLKDHSQISALLNRYKNVFPKNTVPFYEWDGVIYVMCLEPEQFQAPQPIQFVLAPYHTLNKYMDLNESSVATTGALLTGSNETAEVTNPLFKNLQESAKAPSFNFEMPEGFSGKQNEVVSDMPAGLTENIPSYEKMENKETSLLNLTDVEKITSKQTLKNETPEGISFPPSPTESAPYVAEDKVTADDLKKIKTAIVGKEESVMDNAGSFKVEENLIPSMIGLASAEASEQPTKLFDLKVPEPQSSGILIETAGAVIQGFEDVFNQMKKYFTQSMVIGFKNNILAPLKWDASWKKDSSAQNAIDISSPSIFRIVCETHKPYHGYVIPNTINDTFFANWNQGKYPEHVTLYPIIHNKQLIGMVLGTCTKEMSKQYQLHHIESIATVITTHLLKDTLAA